MTRALPRFVYRVLVAETPDESDFRTYRQLGKRVSPRTLEEWPGTDEGCTFYDDLAVAIKVAKSRELGSFVGVLDLSLTGAVEIRKTFGPHHWTIFGDPEELVRIVIEVHPLPP